MRAVPARATIGIAAVTVCVSGGVLLGNVTDIAAAVGGFIPARGSGLKLEGALPFVLTPVSATLLHGGIAHLLLNMLMLVFCGKSIEPVIGMRGVLILYIVSAYAGALAHFLSEPGAYGPMIGASGAVSGLLAAYIRLYGEQKVRLANARLSKALNLLWVLAAWIGFQLLTGLAFAGSTGGIAIFAHIGGFIAGLVLTPLLLRWHYARG